MNTLRAGAGALLTAGALLAGCSASHEAAPAPEHSVSAQMPNEASPAPSFAPGDTTGFFTHNAPINIIYEEPARPHLPPSGPLYASIYSPQIAARLAQGDPSLGSSIQKSFENATYGRYRPAAVTFRHVAGKVAISCLSDGDKTITDAQMAQMQQAASPYNKPGALNIIAIDQAPCNFQPGATVVAGQENTGGSDPVVDAISFTENSLAGFMEHESGHAGDEVHAGTASCQQPATLELCTLNPVNDPLSVMGHTEQDTANRFTYPELGELGLLAKDEVQTINGPGTYTLHVMGRAGLKLLYLRDREQEVFFSDEYDPSASYDEYCKADPNLGSPNDPELSKPNLLLTGETPDDKGYVCLKENQRGLSTSVQVRVPMLATGADTSYGVQEFLADVTRPPRIPDNFDESQIVSGEIRPGQTLYSDIEYTVMLNAISNNSATVSVAKTPAGS